MVCLNQQTNVETYATGIKWIPIISNLSSILHMHFTECKIIQNPDLAPAFFAAIEQNRGFVWIFSTSRDAKLEKLDGEAATTLTSIGLSTKPFSSELTLARPYAMRTAAQQHPPQPLQFQTSTVLGKTCLIILTSLHFKENCMTVSPSSNVLVWFDSAFQTYQNARKLQ